MAFSLLRPIVIALSLLPFCAYIYHVSTMTPEEFSSVYPNVIEWIRQTIADHEHSGKSVASIRFRRLPLYFSKQLLETTKVVSVDRVPVPPLSSMGLQRFEKLERGDYDGIT